MAEVYARFAGQRPHLSDDCDSAERYLKVVKQGSKVVPNLKSLRQSMAERQRRENGEPGLTKPSAARMAELRLRGSQGSGLPKPKSARAIKDNPNKVNQNFDNTADPHIQTGEVEGKDWERQASIDNLLAEISRLKATKSVRVKHKMFAIVEEEGEWEAEADG